MSAGDATTTPRRAGPELEHVKLHGHKVGFLRAGEGPLIVLVHGITSSSDIWRGVIRELSDRYTVVVSLNGQYGDWKSLDEAGYEQAKQRLVDESVVALEKFIPDVRAKIDWTEAATPRTIERYTTHFGGTSFGTKFEGLKVSMDLPEKLPGLFHAGSVGIIMSGWLGTINYGVIVANKIDKYLFAQKAGREVASSG